MELARDLLDKQLLDRDRRKVGKVDGIVLELRRDQPPRLVCLEVGAVTLARRLHRGLALRLVRLTRRWGGSGRPYRIPWSRVRDVGIDVEVDLDATRTPLYATERWLRRHFIERIPGG